MILKQRFWETKQASTETCLLKNEMFDFELKCKPTLWYYISECLFQMGFGVHNNTALCELAELCEFKRHFGGSVVALGHLSIIYQSFKLGCTQFMYLSKT